MSEHSRIAKGMGLVAVFMLLGKFIGAAKEMAMAYRYGVSEIVDVYTLAFTITALPPMVWTGVLATVFVPMVKRVEAMDRNLFVQQLSGLTLLLGGSLSLAFFYIAPQLVPWIWGGYSLEDQALLASMFAGLAPMMFLIFLIGLLAAQLLAMELHSNTLMEIFPSLILALAVLFVPTSFNVSIPLIGGTLLGFTIQFLGLYLLLKRAGTVPKGVLGFNSPGWAIFRNAIGVMTVGHLIMSFVLPVDLYLASQLGTGQVATYGYANRLLLLFMGLGATAVGRAILPVLSDNDSPILRRKLAFQWSNGLLALGGLVVLVAWVLMPWMVQILFERGAFTSEDSVNVTRTIRFGLLQLPVYFSGIVLVQLFASEERFFEIGISSAIALTAKIVFGFIGAHYFGLPGIMASAVFMYLSTYFYFFIRLRARIT